jgi:hypothetical protein
MSIDRLTELRSKPIKELTNREFNELGRLEGDEALAYGGQFEEEEPEIPDNDELFWKEN